MSFFSLGRLVCIFSGLGLSSLAPLAISSPEQFPEKVFNLSNCVINTWGNYNANLFKCIQEDDGSNWAFYLNTSWNNWFYGNNRGGQSNDLSNTTLTIEKGHSIIKVSNVKGERSINKTLEVIQLKNPNSKVKGYAPATINKQADNKSLKEQLTASLQNIESEVTRNKK